MINPSETVRAILLADASVVAQVGDRVWGGMVPPNEVPHMPRKSITFFTDGLPDRDLLTVLRFRIIVWCFGAEPGFNEAWDVARAVFDCLKRGGTQMVTVTGGQVHYYISWCNDAGREVSEPVTHWPRVTAEYEFHFNEGVV